MADMMVFPDTVEEFMEQYKMVDRDQVYSNGTEYVPIYRMNQWFDHIKAQRSDSDLIRREDALKALRLEYPMMPMFKSMRNDWATRTEGYREAERIILEVPAVEPKVKVITNIYLDEDKMREIAQKSAEKAIREYKQTSSYWIVLSNDKIRCHECKRPIAWFGAARNEYPKYCPNCGAFMIGARHE